MPLFDIKKRKPATKDRSSLKATHTNRNNSLRAAVGWELTKSFIDRSKLHGWRPSVNSVAETRDRDIVIAVVIEKFVIC